MRERKTKLNNNSPAEIPLPPLPALKTDTSSPTEQLTGLVMMTPPTSFFFNSETAMDNIFMNAPLVPRRDVQRRALEEYSAFHYMLTEEFGIRVNVALSDRRDAPDSVYLNNWFSTHTHEGKSTLVLYPMKAESRR
jgi:hypothetical protein